MIKQSQVSNFIDLIKRLKSQKQLYSKVSTLYTSPKNSKNQSSQPQMEKIKKTLRIKRKKIKQQPQKDTKEAKGLGLQQYFSAVQLTDHSKTNLYQMYCQELQRKYYIKSQFQESENISKQQNALNKQLLEIQKTMYIPGENKYRSFRPRYHQGKQKVERKSLEPILYKQAKQMMKVKTSSHYKKNQPSELLIGQVSSSTKMPKVSNLTMLKSIKQMPSTSKYQKHYFNSFNEDQFKIKNSGRMPNNKLHRIEGWQQNNYDEMLKSFNF